MKLLIDPHGDDAALFACWTVLRERPLVLVVLDSYLQEQRGHQITWRQRRAETAAAMSILGVHVEFLGFRDDEPDWDGIIAGLKRFGYSEKAFAPALEDGGHAHHNELASISALLFPELTMYKTYTKAGKSTGVPVHYEPEWPILKLKALACYESQIKLASTAPHFLRSQEEYYAA